MEVYKIKDLKKELECGTNYIVYVIQPSKLLLSMLAKVSGPVYLVSAVSDPVVTTIGITFAAVVAYAIFKGYTIRIKVKDIIENEYVEVEFNKPE